MIMSRFNFMRIKFRIIGAVCGESRELNLELSELYAVKVARTVLNGESGSNAADLHNYKYTKIFLRLNFEFNQTVFW